MFRDLRQLWRPSAAALLRPSRLQRNRAEQTERAGGLPNDGPAVGMQKQLEARQQQRMQQNSLPWNLDLHGLVFVLQGPREGSPVTDRPLRGAGKGSAVQLRGSFRSNGNPAVQRARDASDRIPVFLLEGQEPILLVTQLEKVLRRSRVQEQVLSILRAGRDLNSLARQSPTLSTDCLSET